jgi:hypothetical protein
MNKLRTLLTHFNEWLALQLTKTVSTMWCAYFFALLALIALPSALSGGVLAIVQWVSQTFIQLVMLSVIMVGQAIMSKQAAQHHEIVKAIHAKVHEE